MEPTTQNQKNGTTKTKGIEAVEAVEEQVEHVETALKQRVDQVSDIVEDVRDRVEMAIHERPYLVPAAAGALGLGVGILIGSKLSRMLVLGAAGALLSDTVRTQVLKAGKQILSNLSEEIDETEDVEEPSSV
jgi:ElaB/YqjD/DUF883 family membrane-anchored ribosome-binding protein